MARPFSSAVMLLMLLTARGEKSCAKEEEEEIAVLQAGIHRSYSSAGRHNNSELATSRAKSLDFPSATWGPSHGQQGASGTRKMKSAEATEDKSDKAGIIEPASATDISKAIKSSEGSISACGGATGAPDCAGGKTAFKLSSKMNKCLKADPDRLMVTVQGGIRLSGLQKCANEAGILVPDAESGSVGMGYYLMGGIGHTTRFQGLGMDCITGYEIVLPDGRHVTVGEVLATDPESPEPEHLEGEDAEALLWAMKGAAPQLGVVVGLTIKGDAIRDVKTKFGFYPLDKHGELDGMRVFRQYVLHSTNSPRCQNADGGIFWDMEQEAWALGVWDWDLCTDEEMPPPPANPNKCKPNSHLPAFIAAPTPEECKACSGSDSKDWPCGPSHGYLPCVCGGSTVLNHGMQIPGLEPFRNTTHDAEPPTKWYDLDPGNIPQEMGGIGMPWAPNGDYNNWFFYNDAVYLPRAAPMEDIYIILMEHLHNAPSSNSNYIFQHGGGKVNEVAIDATTFPNRWMEWMILINCQGDKEEDVKKWVNDVMRDLLPYSYGTSVTDFRGYPSEWTAYGFGQNTVKTCKQKSKWDPDGRMQDGNFYFTEWCKDDVLYAE